MKDLFFSLVNNCMCASLPFPFSLKTNKQTKNNDDFFQSLLPGFWTCEVRWEAGISSTNWVHPGVLI